MSILDVLVVAVAANPLSSLLLAAVGFILARTIYRLYLHPIAHIPGPKLAASTNAWVNYHSYVGDEATAIHALHGIYGPIVRIAPNDVHIADGAAFPPIYTEKGGFLKSACYENFHIDEHPTIFSALDPAHRAPRAKAVVPLFSTASLRAGSDIIEECVQKFSRRMMDEAKTGQPVNVLNLARSLATDAVSAYLFGRSYGGIEEKSSMLSSSPFVDAFVAVGRFFYLPNTVFLWLEWFIGVTMPDTHTNQSMEAVDKFISEVVDNAGTDSFPARLLKQGFSKSETKAQCKDLVFAGTDSSAMNLATICWHLAKNPNHYQKLRQEVAEHNATGSSANIQALPYLAGTVKEGLRLSMANPTRLPRLVPASGWNFGGYHFPAGTVVGIAPYELHLSPSTFPEPERFNPERWYKPTDEMLRDFMPFGGGTRTCIAKNLATVELFTAVRALVESDVLAGAQAVQDQVVIKEWFNSKVIGERIDLVWPRTAISVVE